jgi:hypothetical protein
MSTTIAQPEKEAENVSLPIRLIFKDWFFDIIINFLRSPRWKTPIMSFLDEHCIIFDSEDENKLEYTIKHMVKIFILKA